MTGIIKKNIPLILFLTQLSAVLFTSKYLGSEIAPWSVLLISGIVIYFTFMGLLELPEKSYESTGFSIWKFAPAIFLILFSPFIYKEFQFFIDVDKYTDVIGQLHTQYNRFKLGITPYSPVNSFAHSPYPVYMPMHWLPMGLAIMVKIDVRWSGYIALIFASVVYGGYLIKNIPDNSQRLLGALFPVLSVALFFIQKSNEIALSLETLIAAYYLLLVTGLLARNHFLILLGAILCILSRYTLVFWCPLFAFIYFKEYDLKLNIRLWSSVVVSILLLYVFPFWLKDHTILIKGITYHNQCAINLLKYSSNGVHLADFISRNTKGGDAHVVMILRGIQGVSMLLINAIGAFVYYRFRDTIHPLDIAALFLYIIIIVFFLTSPMVFYYYYLVPFVILGALMTRLSMAHTLTTS